MANNGLEVDKRIYDCVHGYIELTEKEVNVINAPVFQRLHHIQQLGLTYLVYPTARHTRFSHSLGTLYVVSEFIDALREHTDDSTPFETEHEVQVLRLACLLHDVGHHPFSHVIETPVEDYDGEEGKHENLAKWMIENTRIQDYLTEDEIEQIHAMITRTHTEGVYNSLVSSDLDADRLDYLLRDAYFTGVAYGTVDLHRLLGIARIKAKQIVYDVKGLTTIEAYLMARMAMYRAVYYHKTSAGFGLLLKRIYTHLRDEGEVYSLEEIKKFDEDELVSYNDNYIFKKLRQLMNTNGIYGKMAEAIIHRKPLKLTDAVHSYETESKYTRLAPLQHNPPIQSLAKDAKIDPEWIFYDRAVSKFIEIEESPIMIDHEEWNDPIAITEYQNSAIRDLIDKRYFEDRVYTRHDNSPKLKTAIRDRFGRGFL